MPNDFVTLFGIETQTIDVCTDFALEIESQYRLTDIRVQFVHVERPLDERVVDVIGRHTKVDVQLELLEYVHTSSNGNARVVCARWVVLIDPNRSKREGAIVARPFGRRQCISQKRVYQTMALGDVDLHVDDRIDHSFVVRRSRL